MSRRPLAGLRPLAASLIATAAAACVPHTPRPTDKLFPTSPMVIGHRGAAGLAPENTDAAFKVAADLGVALDQVNVKATTTEKLGFTGREEGIAVHAVALLLADV